MKSVGISELRQNVSDVIRDAQTSDEPVVVLQRSHRAAYIVGRERYERDQDELRALRRAVFLMEVEEAEAEQRSGRTRRYLDIEELLDELGS